MKLLPILFFFAFCGCKSPDSLTTEKESQPTHEISNPVSKPKKIKTGADVFFEKIAESDPEKVKKMVVAAVVNQTSRVGDNHLIDSLLAVGGQVKTIFAPEHGFRGTADAGEKIKDGKDSKTGLPIISLYGKHKKPTAEDLQGIDAVIFDIQDVGARFYTYISTMTYVMEACAENGKKFIVFDRPNPNGHYVDGPVLENGFESFVGLHQIPVVHGMTIGEYAKMVNSEGWLENGIQCDLEVIKCENYDHNTPYNLPVKPSPNLPNQTSIYLYPSLCFFEGTVVSVGRGTDFPFQIFGHPDFSMGSFQFTPKPTLGAKYPKLDGKQCFGSNLSRIPLADLRKQNKLNLNYLLGIYKILKTGKEPFFNKNLFFDKLAGTDKLRKQIKAGLSEEEIRATWQADLEAFKKMRKKYLLYPNFE